MARVELMGPGPHQPRDPVHAAEFVEDGAADARGAIGFELDAAVRIEGVDGVHQAEDAGADEIVEFDLVGQFDIDPLGGVLDQGKIMFEERIAGFLVPPGEVIFPSMFDIDGSG